MACSEISISICPFEGGDVDVIIKDRKSGEEICFTSTRKLSDAEFEFVNRVAPSCVFTPYRQFNPRPESKGAA